MLDIIIREQFNVEIPQNVADSLNIRCMFYNRISFPPKEYGWVTQPFPVLVLITEGYTGADIEAVCREAAYAAMDSKKKSVMQSHFAEALKKVKPSVTQAEAKSYEKYMEHLSDVTLGGPSYA